MIGLLSIEQWMAVLFFINFFLILLVWVMIRKIRQVRLSDFPAPSTPDREQDEGDLSRARQGAFDILRMLEPLVEESRDAAVNFDAQIKEKKKLLKDLNDALDSRIIHINLLLSRAETLQKKLETEPPPAKPVRPAPPVTPDPVPARVPPSRAVNLQNQIVDMYEQGYGVEGIAQELSIARGEVQLVVDLKRKFMEMEKNSK